MRMSRGTSRTERRTAATGASLVCLVWLASMSVASCPAPSPDGVLQCYRDAYVNRDLEALDALLAEDYLQVFVVRPRADVVPRAGKIDSARRMFTAEGLRSVSLSFSDGYRVVAGDEPNTWRIENLSPHLESHQDRGMAQLSFHEVPSCVTLYVRLSQPPDSGYVIYREVSFYGDCGER